MRRWVRYETPIMVCVDLDEDGYNGKVVTVVLGDEPEDVQLARDHTGHFLVYDEGMQRVPPTTGQSPSPKTGSGLTDRRDWEEGPYPLRYPGLYDPVPDTDEDVEPADLNQHDPSTTN